MKRILTNDKTGRKKIHNFLNTIVIKFQNFTFLQSIILAGVVLEICSLFLPWGGFGSSLVTVGAFSSFFGIQGLIILGISIITILVLFSQTTKRKCKLATGLQFEDKYIFLFCSIGLLISHINSLVIIKGAYSFFSSAMYHTGIVVSLVGGIMCALGSSIYMRQSSKRGDHAYSYELVDGGDKSEGDEKNITKLPF